MANEGLAATIVFVAVLGSVGLSSCGGDTTDALGPGSALDASESDAIPDAGQDVLLDSSQDQEALDSPDDGVAADVSLDVQPDQSAACAPPSDPTKSALCLTLSPETLTLVPGDPALDGQGVWLIQVFDTPQPELPDGGTPSTLAERVIPAQDGGPDPALMAVYGNPGEIRFDNLPTQVFVRAIFLDNLDAIQGGGIAAGTWIGGYAAPAMMFGGDELAPVALPAGQGTSRVVEVWALRRLRLNLRPKGGLTPLGDGQGSSAFILFDSPNVGGGDAGAPAGYGYGVADCQDLMSTGGISIEGAFIGAGPYYALGIVDDFGAGMDSGPAPGSIVDIDFTGGQPELPPGSLITIPAGAYAYETWLELNLVIPFPGPAPADPVSCTPPAN